MIILQNNLICLRKIQFKEFVIKLQQNLFVLLLIKLFTASHSIPGSSTEPVWKQRISFSRTSELNLPLKTVKMRLNMCSINLNPSIITTKKWAVYKVWGPVLGHCLSLCISCRFRGMTSYIFQSLCLFLCSKPLTPPLWFVTWDDSNLAPVTRDPAPPCPVRAELIC